MESQWTMNTKTPIYKGGDPMDPNTYRTIMIGHTPSQTIWGNRARTAK